MNHVLRALLLSFALSSCGLFIQDSGIKNYRPTQKISSKLNDYQYDFLYLTHLLEEGFPNLETVFPAAERAQQTQESLASLGKDDVSAIQFLLESRSYLSRVKNQHTTIHTQNTSFPQVYPFVLHPYNNNWYLLNTAKQYPRSYLGHLVSAINGLPMAEVERRLSAYTFSENTSTQQQEIASLQLYNRPELLQAIGALTTETAAVSLHFADTSTLRLELAASQAIQEHPLQFKEDSLTAYRAATYFYDLQPADNFVYLQFNKCHDKIDMLDGLKSYVKPWLQPMARGYLKQQFKKKKPSKRVAAYYNPQDPIFKDFIWKMVDSLNKNDIQHLVVDLRHNSGGNLTLGHSVALFFDGERGLAGLFRVCLYLSHLSSLFSSGLCQLTSAFPRGRTAGQLNLTECQYRPFSGGDG